MNGIYIRSDLASECGSGEDIARLDGIECVSRDEDGVGILSLKITNENGEKALGKPRGTYVTLYIGKVWLDGDEELGKKTLVLAREIRKMAKNMTKNIKSVLFAGLGNRYITPDAIGPLSSDGITVTNHVKESDPELFEKLGGIAVSSICPGVPGQTGIETAKLICGAAQSCRPDLIIAADALASRSTERLMTTIQLCDSGLAPGSGIGSDAMPVSRKEMNVPVLAIGVPTVVDSSTLICDFLERTGIEELPPEIARELENERSFFVSPKDADAAVDELSKMISSAVNRAISE